MIVFLFFVLMCLSRRNRIGRNIETTDSEHKATLTFPNFLLDILAPRLLLSSPYFHKDCLEHLVFKNQDYIILLIPLPMLRQ